MLPPSPPTMLPPSPPRSSPAVPVDLGALCVAFSHNARIKSVRCDVLLSAAVTSEDTFPVFHVCDSVASKSFEFLAIVWGGQTGDTSVAVYQCVETQQRIVVKSIPNTRGRNEPTDEPFNIKWVQQLGLDTDFVQARVVFSIDVAAPAFLPGSTDSTLAARTTVIVMQYGGVSMERVSIVFGPPRPGGLDPRVLMLHKVAFMCKRLFDAGMAYVDLKPSNLLYSDACTDNCKTQQRSLATGEFCGGRIMFCDYGAVALVGTTNGAVTYPVPEMPSGVDVLADERAVLHGLGALLVGFVDRLKLRSIVFVNSRKRARDVDTPPTLAAASAHISRQMAQLKTTIKSGNEGLGELLDIAWSKEGTIDAFIEAAGSLIDACTNI